MTVPLENVFSLFDFLCYVSYSFKYYVSRLTLFFIHNFITSFRRTLSIVFVILNQKLPKTVMKKKYVINKAWTYDLKIKSMSQQYIMLYFFILNYIYYISQNSRKNDKWWLGFILSCLSFDLTVYRGHGNLVI